MEDRNQQSHPVAWDLIVVAWDYSATERGGYPGYDDAAKNMPLPAGRNRLAAQEILQTGRVGCVAGFSSDLLILQANSENPAHDGRQSSFYETLKRGEPYQGLLRRAVSGNRRHLQRPQGREVTGRKRCPAVVAELVSQIANVSLQILAGMPRTGSPSRAFPRADMRQPGLPGTQDCRSLPSRSGRRSENLPMSSLAWESASLPPALAAP